MDDEDSFCHMYLHSYGDTLPATKVPGCVLTSNLVHLMSL